MQSRIQIRTCYHIIACTALLLAVLVIMLGAYTRLTDAGLGCPDWPGCYGKMILTTADQAQLQQEAIQQPIVFYKAWTEMMHRYAASILGLCMVSLALIATVKRRDGSPALLWIPWFLVLILGVQAMLGMWTVTLQLMPLVVMAHLMGGMLIAALLCWLVNASWQLPLSYSPGLRVLRPWAVVGLIIIALQIFLGAWTSTNYAALACLSFPFCHSGVWVRMDWFHAFNLISPMGINYEGGQLPIVARTTIHMAHRFGALLTLVYILPFALCLLLISTFSMLRKWGVLLLLLLVLQVILGILNVMLMLPLPIAVAHNGGAALLLLTMVSILYRLYGTDAPALGANDNR